MSGLAQYFQVTAPGLPTVECSRSIGSGVMESAQGIIAPGCFIPVLVRGAFFICVEMSSVLECYTDSDFSTIGKFFPFFVLNFPCSSPCGYNLHLSNQSDSPIEYKAFWAKEK